MSPSHNVKKCTAACVGLIMRHTEGRIQDLNLGVGGGYLQKSKLSLARLNKVRMPKRLDVTRNGPVRAGRMYPYCRQSKVWQIRMEHL